MATFRLQVVSMDGLEYDGEVQQVKLLLSEWALPK